MRLTIPNHGFTTSVTKTATSAACNIAIGLKIMGKKQRAIRRQTPLYLDVDSEWRKLRISDMRNQSTN